MKVSVITRYNTWELRQLLKEATKQKVKIEKIDTGSINDQFDYGILGDVVTWVSSSLNSPNERAIFLEGLKDGTHLVNPGFVSCPKVMDKFFQQKKVEKQLKKISPIPSFIFETKKDLRKAIERGDINYPFIKKPREGARGQGVVLIKNAREFEKRIIVEKVNEDIFQSFIRNDGDYRILVVGGRPLGVIKRTAGKGKIINNISAGGKAHKIEETEVFNKLMKMSSQLAEFFKLGFCGVDIIYDKKKNRYLFLEINTIPQWKGFQRATGINVSAELLNYFKELAGRERRKTNLNIKRYYTRKRDSLAGEKFHLFSRLYLWGGNKQYQKELFKLKGGYLGENKEDTIDMIRKFINEKEKYSRLSCNAMEFRNKIIGKYPLLASYNKILFRNLMSKHIYREDLRPIVKEIIKDSDLLELRRELLDNKKDFLTLSTHAVNYLFFLEVYLRGRKGSHVNSKILYRVASLIKRDSGDELRKRSDIYFITHCVIGESNFYVRKIKRKKGTYLKMIKIAEQLIKEDYFDTLIDVKFEFLVCCRILDYDSELEGMILQEADCSYSPIGNFLIDTFNVGKKKRGNQGFLGAEHKNVLYLMAHTPFVEVAH